MYQLEHILKRSFTFPFFFNPLGWGLNLKKKHPYHSATVIEIRVGIYKLSVLVFTNMIIFNIYKYKYKRKVAISCSIMYALVLLSSAPVSYTHLDVYKRQVRSLRRERSIASGQK